MITHGFECATGANNREMMAGPVTRGGEGVLPVAKSRGTRKDKRANGEGECEDRTTRSSFVQM